MKSHYFGSVFTTYSCTLWDIIIFHGNQTTPHDPLIPKSGSRDPQPLGLTPM